MRLIDAPIGIFRFDSELVLKTEYYSEDKQSGKYIPDCYIIRTGEYFWGGTKTANELINLDIEPVDFAELLPTVTDTISRQAAIDALRKLREEDIEDYGCEIVEGFNQDNLDRATFAIKQLPPIHPVNNSEMPNSSDVISRQQAIDYFVTNVGFHDEDGYPIEDECELREIWTGYFDSIPSAQPKNENLKFLEFLWNTINPNEMEQYLEMYSSKEVKSNG